MRGFPKGDADSTSECELQSVEPSAGAAADVGITQTPLAKKVGDTLRQILHRRMDAAQGGWEAALDSIGLERAQVPEESVPRHQECVTRSRRCSGSSI